MIRWSITGITTSESHFSCWVTFRQPSGSNVRRSTTVEPSSIDSARCAKPQVWNSGAATWVRQPYFSGIRESSETAASIPASLRGAPFGVPVVPDVRITMRPCRPAGSTSESGWEAIRPSRVWPSASPSVHASTDVPTSAFSSIAVNSSSWITTVGLSRSSTSTSCGPAKAVLR